MNFEKINTGNQSEDQEKPKSLDEIYALVLQADPRLNRSSVEDLVGKHLMRLQKEASDKGEETPTWSRNMQGVVENIVTKKLGEEALGKDLSEEEKKALESWVQRQEADIQSTKESGLARGKEGMPETDFEGAQKMADKVWDSYQEDLQREKAEGKSKEGEN